MTVFATVIAVTKDLLDVGGYADYGVTTFASKFGVKAVSRFATVLLSSTYILAMVLPFIALTAEFKKLPMLIGHGSFLKFFLDSYSKLDSSKMDRIQYFYKATLKLFIWNVASILLYKPQKSFSIKKISVDFKVTEK